MKRFIRESGGKLKVKRSQWFVCFVFFFFLSVLEGSWARVVWAHQD